MEERLAGMIRELGGTEGGAPWSSADIQVRRQLAESIRRELGVRPERDVWSNIMARVVPGRGPVILVGVHPENGGRGAWYGVAAALAAMEGVRELRTQHPVELVLLAPEENSPFGLPGLGSRGLTGSLEHGDLAGIVDRHGDSLAGAVRRAGGGPGQRRVVYGAGSIRAYVELRCGGQPFLEEVGAAFGAATGVAGMSRSRLSIGGDEQPGAAPMGRRRDSLAAAAEIVLLVEELARSEAGLATATAGRIWVSPNEIDIVPGLASLDIEVQGSSTPAIGRIVQGIEERGRDIAARRNVSIAGAETFYADPVPFSARIRAATLQAARDLGLACAETTAPPGHDARVFSSVAEAGMILASGCTTEAMACAARVLRSVVLAVDGTERRPA